MTANIVSITVMDVLLYPSPVSCPPSLHQWQQRPLLHLWWLGEQEGEYLTIDQFIVWLDLLSTDNSKWIWICIPYLYSKHRYLLDFCLQIINWTFKFYSFFKQTFDTDFVTCELKFLAVCLLIHVWKLGDCTTDTLTVSNPGGAEPPTSGTSTWPPPPQPYISS